MKEEKKILVEPEIFKNEVSKIVQNIEETIIRDMKYYNNDSLPFFEKVFMSQGDLALSGVEEAFWFYEFQPIEVTLTDNKLFLTIEKTVGGFTPKGEFKMEFNKLTVDLALALYKQLHDQFYLEKV